MLFVRKNALQILIPKYGLEGTIFLNAKEKGGPSLFTYDEEVKVLERCVCVCVCVCVCGGGRREGQGGEGIGS